MLKRIVDTLELAFDLFNESKFNNTLPQAIITIQSKGKQDCYGWCTVSPIWEGDGEEKYYEINISAEYLNRPYAAIMETLLHEMCHLYNSVNGIEDCNKKQFHNEKFKEVAESVGLVVEKVKQHGWAKTSFSEGLKKEVELWKIDKEVFNICRMDKPVKKVIKKSSKVKLVCPECKCKVSADDEIVIVCGTCGNEFVRSGKKQG